jgi:AcrR family transcriptional regulator
MTKKKDNESSIFKAAIALFAENGFGHTTISDIANKAIITEGLVYYYFISKDDILLSISLTFWKDFNSKIDQTLLRERNQKPSEKLQTIMKVARHKLAKDKLSLYLFKVLTEFLPCCFSEYKKHPESKKKLTEKRERIRLENKKFLSLLDEIIIESLKDKNNNPKIIRQILCGAYQKLLNGLFSKTYKEKVDYNKKDVDKVMNELISHFVK